MKTGEKETVGEELVLPFEDLDRSALPMAGGKAANLGELTRACLPVPPGFCVTTAAYELVAEGAGLDKILDALAETPPDETARLAEHAAASRASKTRTSTSSATGPCSMRFGVAGHRSGQIAPSRTARPTASIPTACASPSSCIGWSRP